MSFLVKSKEIRPSCVTIKICYDGYMKNPYFLKLAGVPVLDFVNTWIKHSSHSEDQLSSPEMTAMFFRDFFQEEVKLSNLDYKKILKIRTQLRMLFGHLSKPRAKTDTSKFWPFNKLFKVNFSLLDQVFLPNPQNVRCVQIDMGSQSESILLNQTINFIERLEPLRLKNCQNKNCSHFFYDTSKAGTRTWCSMKSCGNLAKVQKFRKNLK